MSFTSWHHLLFIVRADPLAAEEWLEEITRILETLGIVEGDLRVRFATFQLRDEARHWWKIVQDEVGMSWTDLRETFLEHYIPKTAREHMRDEFFKLSQGTSTVDQYATRFISLFRFVSDFVPTEERRCRRFE